ncbi:MAG TPA: MalY/PatB family protein [Bacilli bacterium]|nr:pyridoxal phosphate-dependent aminotransferase [Bacilli bacterium]HOR17526.1 MalY/PatB family protein [Bacilli bacterium]HPL55036.1 MalY/PatB family protein [Bacilli bacterium]
MNHFNKPINRLNTSSLKWDSIKIRTEKENVLPFWVADSDYMTAKPIMEALTSRIKNGAFGYTYVDQEYLEIVKNWVWRRYQYQIEKDWIVTTPGIVPALFFAINALTTPEAKIIIQSPVYNPFYSVIINNNRKILENKLLPIDNTYQMDFINLEALLKEGAEMMILCSPHNPVGRVWTEAEILKVVKLCKQYNCLLVSDEIHCDLVFKEYPFTSIGKYFHLYDKMIICTAPSKTFNIAGLMTSNIIIKDLTLREKFKRELSIRSIGDPNLFGIEACKAAYTKCDDWLEAQVKHIQKNAMLVNQYFKKHIPEAKIAKLEGTYLMWIDMRFMHLTSETLVKKLIDYGIFVNPGAMYGADYDGFIRLNIACPQQQLQKGLEIIGKFVAEYK